MPDKITKAITILEKFIPEGDGIPASAMLVFSHIAKNNGTLALKDLENLTGVRPKAIEYAVAKLTAVDYRGNEGLNLIERVRGKRGNQKFFYLTPKGKNLARRIKKISSNMAAMADY